MSLEAESMAHNEDFGADPSVVFDKPGRPYKKRSSAMMPVRFTDNKQGVC